MSKQNHNNRQPDLDDCDREAIHLTGSIQPHGFLLIFDRNTLKLEQGSENIYQFLGVGIEKLLGETIQVLIPGEELHRKDYTNTPFPQLIRIKDRQFISHVHRSSGKIIVECEPWSPAPENELIESGHWLASVQAQLNQLETPESIAEFVAGSIQYILDYDRVLVFKFDPDWHAEAVGEKIKPGIRSYQGHHFPASDIPAPARTLLEKKHIRHIPDVNAGPVKILPYLNPATAGPVDILQSELRYPSEIHLEYLRNMNVSSSISFSVIVKGRLWGLVSCTNEKPKFTGFRKRQLCEHVVKACSNTLMSSKEKRDHQQLRHFKQLEKRLIEQLSHNQDIFIGLRGAGPDLLSITESAGAAVILEKRLLTFGVTPEEEHILEIAEWLSENNTEATFQTRELSAYIDNALHYKERACGLLALEISRFNKEYILYFKPEIKEKRIWAGNPEKPVAGEDFRIHPRKSFEKWEEIIRGKSQCWTLNELEMAQILLRDIVALRLKNQNENLEDLNEEYQASAESIRRKNKQLEDFTRIITHNLRSPLVNIQALYAIYKNDSDKAGAGIFLDKIKQASDNMLATIDDLNSILKAGTEGQLQHEIISLSGIIEKELQNMEGAIINTGAEVELQLLAPEVNSHKVYMESIIHNLLSNALKYTFPGRKPEVIIRSWFHKNTFYLSVSDNGSGIDMDKYGHKLFEIYQTFHQNPNSRGVGLYLTRMQIESMGGNIKVDSKPGKGTTFTISLNSSRPVPG